MDVRFNKIRTHLDGRIDEIKETLLQDFRRVEEVLDARLANMEHRLERIENRIGG
jgi:hypothetical protein